MSNRDNMSDYLARAQAVLAAIEDAIDNGAADIEPERHGNLLALEFADGSQIVVNLQPPLHEIWLAAKAGGFHYRYVDGAWRDTRNGTEFFAALSACVSEQAGEVVRIEG
jgi:CyaY protein